jgi:hypothetical protein
LLGSGAISLSLTGTTASSSYIFGITGGVPNNFGGTAPTQGTGWTRAGWTSDPNPGWLYGSAEYNTGIAVNTVPWQVAMGGGIGFYTEASAAIEVLAAASSSHSLLPCRKPLRFFPRRF